MTLNVDRQQERNVRLTLAGSTPQTRNVYRALRRSGFDRRDSNLMTFGCALALEPQTFYIQTREPT